MLDPGVLLAAKTDSLISSESLVKVGGAAGAFALLGLAFVLPLYVTQRREVRRLLLWMQLEPHRGDDGSPVLFTGRPGQAQPSRGITTGEMTPAERVTADRPALERITAERAALESPSFWGRLIARGPRHPLVLSVLAVVVAVAVVAGVVLGVSGVGDDPAGSKSGSLDRAAVSVVVLNGSSEKDFGARVKASVVAAGFTQVRVGRTGKSKQTIVLYSPRQQHPAQLLARKLNAKVVQKIKPSQQAVAAGADVVVIAGEDRARA